MFPTVQERGPERSPSTWFTWGARGPMSNQDEWRQMRLQGLGFVWVCPTLRLHLPYKRCPNFSSIKSIGGRPPRPHRLGGCFVAGDTQTRRHLQCLHASAGNAVNAGNLSEPSERLVGWQIDWYTLLSIFPSLVPSVGGASAHRIVLPIHMLAILLLLSGLLSPLRALRRLSARSSRAPEDDPRG